MARTKLKLNVDGSVIVPLRDGREITLAEPSMRQLAEMHTLYAQADAAKPTLPPMPPQPALPDKPTTEQIVAFRVELDAYVQAADDRVTARRSIESLLYGDADTSPHGQAFLKIMRSLAPEANVTEDDVFGWVMNPATGANLIAHFTAPLGGEDESGG